TKNGGYGAVREILEKILKEQNLWKNIVENFTATEQ
ncbi:MAG: 3-deoxy-D-manno-octulosonate 8-phosphate phosphatase, partial [Fusobacterium sp.]